MAKRDYYLLILHGDVEPELRGPFESAETRDNAARNHRQADDGDLCDGLFPVDVDAGTSINVDTYTGLQLG
ncbi:hypothetical protein A3709_19205 [Halioglobus sp. HI00S01]|uniref:hypothetical protein n=1 Tax=Halioglobus sp. HI00S01 TaxID=1822214 RepID=UPI0007C2BB41|nr:hypothetical protein [Halioglobus sp. HI00S01]KZX57752.1 hypothetical protein A3709_19205 [Halioglobus sp. HI00S01]